MHRAFVCAGLGANCPSRRGGFCDRLDEKGLAMLSASAHLERLPADRVLWHDDGPPVTGVLLSGLLRFERCNSQGRRQILNVILPGELVGPEMDRDAGYSIEAATDATFCRFDTALFERRIADDHALRAEVYRQSLRQLDRLRWLTWIIGTLSPEERVAAFLVAATDYMPFQPQPEGGPVLSVLLSRRDIADLLATTVETTCRILKGLEREGLIVLRDARHIEVPDLAALARRGGVPRESDRPKPGPAARTGAEAQAILLSAPGLPAEAPPRRWS
jgi:CRP/FNR family transcriptional regulator